MPSSSVWRACPDGDPRDLASAAAAGDPAEAISLGGLRDRDLLEEFDSVILRDVPALTEGELDRLRRFVAERRRVDSGPRREGVLGRLRPGLVADLLPAPFGPPTPPLTEQDRPFSFSETDSLHPLLRVFAGNPDAGLLTTPIFRYRPIEGAGPPAGTEVILRLGLSNGAPVLVERRERERTRFADPDRPERRMGELGPVAELPADDARDRPGVDPGS